MLNSSVVHCPTFFSSITVLAVLSRVLYWPTYHIPSYCTTRSGAVPCSLAHIPYSVIPDHTVLPVLSHALYVAPLPYFAIPHGTVPNSPRGLSCAVCPTIFVASCCHIVSQTAPYRIVVYATVPRPIAVSRTVVHLPRVCPRLPDTTTRDSTSGGFSPIKDAAIPWKTLSFCVAAAAAVTGIATVFSSVA